MKAPEFTFLAFSVATAKETKVGGTFKSWKVPDIESFPPIEAVPIAFCADKAPKRAAVGFPQAFLLDVRSKYSWKVKRQESGFPPREAIRAKD